LAGARTSCRLTWIRQLKRRNAFRLIFGQSHSHPATSVTWRKQVCAPSSAQCYSRSQRPSRLRPLAKLQASRRSIKCDSGLAISSSDGSPAQQAVDGLRRLSTLRSGGSPAAAQGAPIATRRDGPRAEGAGRGLFEPVDAGRASSAGLRRPRSNGEGLSRRWGRRRRRAPRPTRRQISSGTILIAPQGHSATQMPQPLQ
jgi:hypothetical protein